MRLGTGVGSAIVGPKGKIVGQAAFRSVPGTAVAAPALLFNTISAIMMAVQFNRIEKTLGGISEGVNRLLEESAAKTLAELRSAFERISDIQVEYDCGPGFTTETRVRLALLERDVAILRHKHHELATSPVGTTDQSQIRTTDQRLFVASSIAGVQVERLRLLLALQDNPNVVQKRLSALEKKAATYRDDARKLAQDDPVKHLRNDLRRSIAEVSWFDKNILRRGKAKEKELGKVATPVDPLALFDEGSPKSAGPAMRYSILTWRDHDGAGDIKAWYTKDYNIEPAERPREANRPGA